MTSVNVTTQNNTVTVQEGDATTVTVTTQGPQGATGAGISAGDKGSLTVAANLTDWTLNDSVVTSAKITDGAIVNADINASAAIELSKLATGALPTAITVTSANISDLSIVDADISGSAAISLSKLATGALPTAITVTSANISDLSIVDADINASAAIAGTKISPDFGSQNITTTGNAIAGQVQIQGSNPRIEFDDTDHNTTFRLNSGGGTLQLQISTNNGASFANAIGIGGVGNIFIPDNDKVNFGSGNDLVIVHDGSDSKITNKTGNLLIEAKDTETGIKVIPDGAVELYHNNVKKIETTSSGVTVTGDISPTGNLNLLDSSSSSVGRVMLGTDSDLQISHTGSGGIIGNYTGTLGIRSNALRLQNGAGTESYIKADENGAVELYYDSSKKFETTSSGVTVTGSVTASTGILFGSDTADANTLDDYEEGTWTPTVLSGGTIGTSQYTSTYTKIGRLVTINTDIHQLSDITSSTNIAIGGLPYVPSGTDGNWSAGCHGERYDSADIIVAFLQYTGGSWKITFRKGVGQNGYSDLKHSDINNAGDNNLRFTLTYELTT